MKKLPPLFYPLIISFLLLSCQRDLEGRLEPKKDCLIEKGYYYYQAAGVYDSVLFSYQDNILIRAEGDLYFATFGYTNGQLSRRMLFDKLDNDRLIAVDSVQYDLDRVSGITSWTYPINSTYDTTRIVFKFSYNGTVLDKINRYSLAYSFPEPARDTIITSFNISPSGNTTHLVMRGTDGGLYDSIHYDYDAMPNHFGNISPAFYLYDPFFTPHQDLVADLPYFISSNNVVRYSYNTTGEDLSTYVTDSLNNLLEFLIGASPYAAYTYKCTD